MSKCAKDYQEAYEKGILKWFRYNIYSLVIFMTNKKITFENS